MQHDATMRTAVRAIYDACYPTEDYAPVGFDEAERCGTIRYRQAVEADQQAGSVFAIQGKHLSMI